MSGLEEKMSFHFMELVIFPGTFWYAILFAVFKMFGVLSLGWGWLALPLVWIFAYLFVCALVGVRHGILEARRTTQERIAAQDAFTAEILKSVEKAKMELEKDGTSEQAN